MKYDVTKLSRKYVFHIPLYRYEENGLVPIGIDGLLDELISEFSKSGFENFYFLKAKAHYKSRCFDELLLVMFAESAEPEAIFRKWFKKGNDVLGQEAFAWECGNSLFVEDLI
ncbi:hypothetical protein [Methanobrevibacter sp.]|uniref:hypothetical protein n=1 Tax=Methanobrevibacter sp. TaxID=66852 RepID=UPI003864B554